MDASSEPKQKAFHLKFEKRFVALKLIGDHLHILLISRSSPVGLTCGLVRSGGHCSFDVVWFI